MRTTLTLDDDVAVGLERLMKRRRRPFKAVVNDVLRLGLNAIDQPKRRRQPFQTKGFNLGSSRVGSLDNIEEVLSRVEGEAHS